MDDDILSDPSFPPFVPTPPGMHYRKIPGKGTRLVETQEPKGKIKQRRPGGDGRKPCPSCGRKPTRSQPAPDLLVLRCDPCGIQVEKPTWGRNIRSVKVELNHKWNSLPRKKLQKELPS